LAPDDPYCGINALTLMEALDAEDPRRAALLPRVQRCTQARVASSAAGFWDHAALLELSVLTDDRAVAQSALKQCEARAQSVERWAPLSTARTLAMIARARDAKQVAAGWIRPVVEKLVQLTG
jgi:hypothetical protein